MPMTRRETYIAKAKTIFQTKITVYGLSDPCNEGVLCKCGTWSQGMWRSAWAFDTLIDYFSACHVDPSKACLVTNVTPFDRRMLDTYLDASHGDWWDDFGWSGIASLRAAQQLNAFKNTWKDFLMNAINCWCYMYGPGWSKPPDQEPEPPTQFTVPFLDVAGWKDFIVNKKKHYNIGALNVWQYAPDAAKKKFPPRFTPGGLWNSTLDDRPAPTDKPNVDCSCPFLSSTQNTVTNALFTILTLRLFIAFGDSAFSQVFTDSKVNRDRVLKAWKSQMDWFNKWFFPNPQDNLESLLYPLSQNYSPGNGKALIRERVSTFGTGKWDSSYCPKLAWTGDQGLMLAALHEANQFLKSKDCSYRGDRQLLEIAAIYKDILRGVTTCCFGKENIPPYNDILFLRPWVQVTLDKNDISVDFSSNFPQGDNPDYQTGCGVFYRYLLQAYASDDQAVAPFKDNVLAAADAICESNFPDPGNIDNLCDCLVVKSTSTGTPCDPMTPWINRLALLCMGIKLADS